MRSARVARWGVRITKTAVLSLTVGVLLTALPAASPALASPINCATSVAACDAIELGGGPYVKFVDNVFNRYIDLANPFQIVQDVVTPNSTAVM